MSGIPQSTPEIEVRRSARRRRTVTAYREGGRTIVLIPARFSKAEEKRWVADMVARLEAREKRSRTGARRSDDALMARAMTLSGKYLDGRARPSVIRWVGNMNSRWGSCTPVDGSIRISERLREMPPWVLDYVLMHELTHLLAPGHDDRFWALVSAYPRTERARGYLEGVAAASHLELAADDVLPEDDS